MLFSPLPLFTGPSGPLSMVVFVKKALITGQIRRARFNVSWLVLKPKRRFWCCPITGEGLSLRYNAFALLVSFPYVGVV